MTASFPFFDSYTAGKLKNMKGRSFFPHSASYTIWFFLCSVYKVPFLVKQTVIKAKIIFKMSLKQKDNAFVSDNKLPVSGI